MEKVFSNLQKVGKPAAIELLRKLQNHQLVARIASHV
jgi:hypothetical protein